MKTVYTVNELFRQTFLTDLIVSYRNGYIGAVETESIEVVDTGTVVHVR